jgi:hypothetical protein
MLIKKIMKNVKNWAKKKAAIMSLAFANVEKNTFGQNGESLSSDINQERRHTQGQLSDALVHGEITQEVMDLRWRTYKILRQTDGVVVEIVGYDDYGYPIVKTKKSDKKIGLDKIKIDPTNSYPLEMVVDNNEITLSVNESLDNTLINTTNTLKVETNTFIKVDDNSETITGKEENVVIHGDISANDFFASHKTQKPITIVRTFFPKFSIENFTKKLNIRNINGDNKLLEFYVSMYPDEYNKTSTFFINELKKAIKNPASTNMLDIKEVGFITYKTTGAEDFLEYSYEITSFDKIVEFNGHYVIKFLAKVKINGVDILEKHRMFELDEKYKNKTKKKQ